MKIAVLNASNPQRIDLESDVYVDYREGRMKCFDDTEIIKKCTSWHSWAYAIESEFFVYNKPGWPGVFKYDGIILLVHRDIHLLFPLVDKLKSQKKKVFVAFHEGLGTFINPYDPTNPQTNPSVFNKVTHLQKLVNKCDGFINIFHHAQSFWRGILDKPICLVNHCWPFDWDRTKLFVPWDKRKKILIGTRTFSQFNARNTMITIGACLACKKKYPNIQIDMVCEDGLTDSQFDWLTKNHIGVARGGLSYSNWLKLIANYQMIVHHDTSLNLGQISGDALLMKVLPVGGTTQINMDLGTDDKGSSDLLEMLISKDYYERMNPDDFAYPNDWICGRYHPDTVKKDLEWIFNET